jgi:hypothetical protein
MSAKENLPPHIGKPKTTSQPCFLTDKGYRNAIVSSRENVTEMGALCKRPIGTLWLRDGLEEHLLDVIDLRAEGNKV